MPVKNSNSLLQVPPPTTLTDKSPRMVSVSYTHLDVYKRQQYNYLFGGQGRNDALYLLDAAGE